MTEPNAIAAAPPEPAESNIDDFVPEAWPAPAEPATVETRPISWLLFPFTPVLIVLRPTAIGVRLARSSWPKAVLAHLMSLLAIWAMAVAVEVILDDSFTGQWSSYTSRWRFESVSWERLTPGEKLRFPFAAVVTTLYDGPGDIDAATVGIAAASAHGGCWLIALLAMPLFAICERPRKLFGRCLKLSLWSTVCFAPAMAVGAIFFVAAATDVPGRWDDWLRTVVVDKVVASGLVLLFVVPWWFGVLTRLAARPPQPASSSGWAPPPPRCGGCGYTIIGLPTRGRCPECGRAVSDSMPDARRPPAWVAAKRVWRRPFAYVKTARDVWRDPRFFDTLAVRCPTHDAARFAVWTCALAGALLSCGFVAPAYAKIVHAPNVGKLIHALEPTIGGGLSVAAVSLAAICVIALRSAFTARIDPRITWNAVLYSSVYLLPIAAVLCAGWWIDRLLYLYTDIGEWVIRTGWRGVEIDGEQVVWVVIGCGAFAAGVLGTVRLRRAILAVRFAT